MFYVAKGSSRAVSWPSFLNVLLLATIKKAGSHMAEDSLGGRVRLAKTTSTGNQRPFNPSWGSALFWLRCLNYGSISSPPLLIWVWQSGSHRLRFCLFVCFYLTNLLALLYSKFVLLNQRCNLQFGKQSLLLRNSFLDMLCTISLA